MKALVLCAGFGTRLGALTRDRPKPMLLIDGQPLVGYLLRYLAHFGYTDVAMNLHYRGDQIRRYVGDGSQFGVRAHYVTEEKPLGTAGALSNLRKFFEGEQDFLVIYGDLLIDQDLSALLSFHRHHHGEATLLLHQRAGSNSFVCIDCNSRITKLIERPVESVTDGSLSYVNSGLYILNRSVLSQISGPGQSDFPRDIFPQMIKQGVPIYGFILTGNRCAIDSEARYREANEQMIAGVFRCY